jgi:hypothetical protein
MLKKLGRKTQIKTKSTTSHYYILKTHVVE